MKVKNIRYIFDRICFSLLFVELYERKTKINIKRKMKNEDKDEEKDEEKDEDEKYEESKEK
jgi:hypothetical protein